MLIGEPLVLELTTTAIQYKDSILIPYFMYRSNLSTSTSEFGYFGTCYWFYYPKKKIITFIVLFFSYWMISGSYYVHEFNSLKLFESC